MSCTVKKAKNKGDKMGKEDVSSKPKTLHKVINVALILINVNGALVMFSVYSFDEFQYYERLIILISSLMLTAFMIIKEFKVKPLLKRIYFNFAIWMGFMAISYYIFISW